MFKTNTIACIMFNIAHPFVDLKMITLSEIVDEEVELQSLLSKPLQDLIAQKEVELKLVSYEEQDLLNEMNLLIEETFPAKEAEHYKPGFIFDTEENPLCFVCLEKEEIIGGITVHFDFEDNSVTLISIAVAKKLQNKKIGSLLMLALHDICLELDITSISLISSPAGKAFYNSFGFTEKGHNSFERSIPFEEQIIQSKFSSCDTQNQGISDTVEGLKTKRSHLTLMNSSIFKPETIDKENDEDQTKSLHRDKRRRIM